MLASFQYSLCRWICHLWTVPQTYTEICASIIGRGLVCTRNGCMKAFSTNRCVGLLTVSCGKMVRTAGGHSYGVKFVNKKVFGEAFSVWSQPPLSLEMYFPLSSCGEGNAIDVCGRFSTYPVPSRLGDPGSLFETVEENDKKKQFELGGLANANAQREGWNGTSCD